MEKKRKVDLLIFVVAAILCVLSLFFLSGALRNVSAIVSGTVAVCFLLFALQRHPQVQQQQQDVPAPPSSAEDAPAGGITELALLNEEDEIIATWELYGKTSMVIGRDVRENQVNINLNHAAFASMIDVEHATLNYAGGNWYVEDLGSKNGVSVVKADGKKYRLAPDKPCLLAPGDFLYIAMTKLLLR